jgi:hypothetical protein
MMLGVRRVDTGVSLMEAKEERFRRRGRRSRLGESGGERVPVVNRQNLTMLSHSLYVARSICRAVPRSWDSFRKNRTNKKSIASNADDIMFGNRNLKLDS